jgi:hypothetical protein
MSECLNPNWEGSIFAFRTQEWLNRARVAELRQAQDSALSFKTPNVVAECFVFGVPGFKPRSEDRLFWLRSFCGFPQSLQANEIAPYNTPRPSPSISCSCSFTRLFCLLLDIAVQHSSHSMALGSGGEEKIYSDITDTQEARPLYREHNTQFHGLSNLCSYRPAYWALLCRQYLTYNFAHSNWQAL